MGKYPRRRPGRLTEKPALVRTSPGLSQNGMLRHLGVADEMLQARISSYELGTREPPLPVLLVYARAANVYVDALVDDDIDLPERLPSAKKSEGKKRGPAPCGKRR